MCLKPPHQAAQIQSQKGARRQPDYHTAAAVRYATVPVRLKSMLRSLTVVARHRNLHSVGLYHYLSAPKSEAGGGLSVQKNSVVHDAVAGLSRLVCTRSDAVLEGTRRHGLDDFHSFGCRMHSSIGAFVVVVTGA